MDFCSVILADKYFGLELKDSEQPILEEFKHFGSWGYTCGESEYCELVGEYNAQSNSCDIS
jgi:hypothetical protein